MSSADLISMAVLQNHTVSLTCKRVLSTGNLAGPDWAKVPESEVSHVGARCKGVHSLMPDLGHSMNGDELVQQLSGFHQRYRRAR